MCLKMKKRAVLCAVAAAIMLSSGTPQINMTVLASSPVSEAEALSQAVELYERLTDGQVSVPDGLDDMGLDSDMLKSITLGYVNLEDTEEALQEKTIRKQDFVSILYKAIVSYNDSYIIYEDETNSILNTCYDNAYIDDENRIAYAFMMKQGIITGKIGSEPNKELTKEECSNLVSAVYDNFAQNVTLYINGKGITVGSNVSTVLDTFGQPNRIDETEYGFEWYVYNSDYSEFVMVGVEADRVCAFFSNSACFEMDAIRSGDDFAVTADYTDNRCYRFYPATDGKIDSVMYNPRYRDGEDTASIKRSKSVILIDITNANRSKNMRPIYVENPDMSAQAWLSSLNMMEYDSSMTTQSGFDVFSVYRQLLEQDSEILSQDTAYATPVGVSTSTDLSGGIRTSITTDTERIAEIPETETVELPESDYTVHEVEEVIAPVLRLPATEKEYNDGDDIVIQLEEQAATQYHIEVFDVESDEYAVNEYIITDSTEIILPSLLFENGSDYRIVVSSITPDGEALSADEVFISYGSAYDTGVEIITPYNDGVTDDDNISIVWNSNSYHDFYVDLYCDGELIASKIVEDKYEALIQGVMPGKYYLYVTALRRGTWGQAAD